MIQIEATAEFDAEGKFTVTAQTTEPVPPGPYRVIIQVPELTPADAQEVSSDEQPSEPAIKQVGNLLLFTGKLLEDPEAVRRRLDDERAHQLLYGPYA